MNNLGCTAGDIALSFNEPELYNLIRDAGIRSEMLLSLLSSKSQTPSSLVLSTDDDSAAASTKKFLSSKLRFTKDEHGQDICMLQVGPDVEIGVMMGWEREIMQETVIALCDQHANADELKVLNVGFGLGIVSSVLELGLLLLHNTPDRFHVSKSLQAARTPLYYRASQRCTSLYVF